MQYIDIAKYLRDDIKFNFFVGGRGNGKTWSGSRFTTTSGKKFLFLRTTTKEIDIASDSNELGKSNKRVKASKINEDLWGYYDKEKLIGYGSALSIFKNLRGVNFEDVEIILQDEFIPEVNARKIIKDEATAWFNMIETVNRNRELEGRPPVLYIGLANANEIYNPYFVELGIIENLEEMFSYGKKRYVDEERSLQVVMLESPAEFIEAKQKTALYKLAKGTKFEQMALNNEFAYNDFTLVKKMDIKGYQPYLQYGDYILWKKKGSDFLIVRKNKNEKFKIFYDVENEIEKGIFIKQFKELFYVAFLNKKIYFENYEAKRKTFDIFKLKC